MRRLRLQGVTKRFGNVVAVDDLDLEVPRGSLYGFIGPNGSGKTTTLRMIMHILLPDQGEIEVLGQRDTRAAHDRVSYLPEERGLYKRMSVRRLLRYFGALKGAAQPELDRSIDDWLERMGLSDWIDKKVDALSKGMAQKVQFIATVLNRPELLILDEPFSGLDPVNAEVLKDAVLDLKKAGHDGRLLDPRHGGRRAALRPDLHDLQGPEGARRHARRDPVDLRLRHDPGPDRRGRAAARGPATGSTRSTTRATSRRCAGAGDPQDLLAGPGGPDPDPPVRDRPPVAARHLRPHRRARAGLRLEDASSHEPDLRKIWVVATTEFGSAIRTKSFIIGILLLPIIMGASILIQLFVAERADTKPRQFVVIDRHAACSIPPIEQAAEAHNAKPARGARRKRRAAEDRAASRRSASGRIGRSRARAGALRPDPPRRARRLRRDPRRGDRAAAPGRDRAGHRSTTPTTRTTTSSATGCGEVINDEVRAPAVPLGRARPGRWPTRLEPAGQVETSSLVERTRQRGPGSRGRSSRRRRSTRSARRSSRRC